MRYDEFKNYVVEAAKNSGLKEYELYYKESESVSTETLMHEISGFSTSGGAGACFRCIHEGKMGYASTELFTAEEAARIVAAAMENASIIEIEDEVFIHEAGDNYVELEPQKTYEPTSAEMIEQALALEKALYEADERVMDGSQAFFGFGKETVGLCNSKGLDLSYSYDYSEYGAVAVIKEGEEMFNAFEVKAGDFKEADGAALAKGVVADAIDSIGQESVTSGVYNIVFSNKMMASMLNTFFGIFSAENAQRGLSLLNDKVGEVIASDVVTIMDDPFRKETYNCMPFDGEGVATSCKAVVEKGQLKTLLHNLTTAHKAGVASTGNGRKASYAAPVAILPYNFFVEKGGAGNKEDLFAKAGEAIYVTEINGMHAGANAVTGDFSLAAEGFLVTEGKRAHAVKNFTISGNFYELLKNVVAVGDDLEFGSPHGGCTYGAPSVWAKEISVAGK